MTVFIKLPRPLYQLRTQEKLVSDGVGEEAASVLAECLWVRREEVRSQLARDSCAISHSVLRDYDWKMKVSLISTMTCFNY